MGGRAKHFLLTNAECMQGLQSKTTSVLYLSCQRVDATAQHALALKQVSRVAVVKVIQAILGRAGEHLIMQW